MRILQVIHDFLPKHRAGAEICANNICRELSERHKVHLLFTDTVPDLPQYSARDGSFNEFSYTRVINNHCHKRFEELYNNPRMDTVFRSVLDSFRPDIVHFQHLMHHSANYPRLASERGIPSVMTLHDFWPICEQWGKRIRSYLPGEQRDSGEWEREPFGSAKLCDTILPELCAKCFNRNPTVGSRLERNLSEAGALDRAGDLALRAARCLLGMDLTAMADRLKGREEKSDGAPAQPGPLADSDIARRNKYIYEALSPVYRFVSPSHFLAEEMKRQGYPEDKLLVSDYGLRTELFKGFQRTRDTRTRFGYIGTIAELKGVHVSVKAFRLLNDRRATLEIFGGTQAFPDYSAWLREMADEAAINFHDWFDPENVADVFSRFDVLIVPSIWYENSPFVIHEAFLSHTPVVASRLGGMPGLIEDGRTGLLFSHGDAEDLAAKMKMLLDAPDLLEKMGLAAPHVKTISEDALEFERLYEEALSKSR